MIIYRQNSRGEYLLSPEERLYSYSSLVMTEEEERLYAMAAIKNWGSKVTGAGQKLAKKVSNNAKFINRHPTRALDNAITRVVTHPVETVGAGVGMAAVGVVSPTLMATPVKYAGTIPGSKVGETVANYITKGRYGQNAAARATKYGNSKFSQNLVKNQDKSIKELFNGLIKKKK